MNVLIIEGYTNANIGSCALVENSIHLLETEWKVPRRNIRVMSHTHEVFSVYGVETVPDFFAYPYRQNRIRQIFWFIHTLSWMLTSWLLPTRALKTRRWADFQWADTVVSIGAERVNDKFIKAIFFSLYTYAMARRMGRKMVMFPSTYGPFLYRWTRRLAAWTFSRLDAVFCRDQASYDTVMTFDGVDSRRVVNTYDVAIIQDHSPATAQDLFTKYLGHKIDGPIIGVSVLRWTYRANKAETPYSNYESYAQEMAKLVDWILDTYPVQVVFYPTNFPVNGCREDDVEVALHIQGMLRSKDRTHVPTELPTPTEFKSMVSVSEVNIVTRMHACILSTGAHIPTLSVNYLFKLREYMAGLGLGRYSMDIEDFHADPFKALVGEVWENRAQIKMDLGKRLKDMSEQLRSSLRTGLELLSDETSA